MTTRILLADGEPLFREGLAQLLATQRDFQLVGEASDTWETVEKTRVLHPDLALVALDLPGMGGAETARRIRGANPDTKVIVLAPPRSNGEFKRIEQVANGILVRSVRASQFFAQIRGIVGEGGSVRRDPLAATVLREADSGNFRERLTPREREVFELLAEGWSNRQIQNALGIRESTVKRHVRRILRKLRVRNRVQAAVYAARRSLYQREGVRRA